MISESTDSEGYLAEDSIKNEIKFEEILSKYGIRTSKVLAIIKPKSKDFADWVHTIDDNLNNISYYPAYNMLQRLLAKNDQPAILVRAEGIRYTQGLRVDTHDNYSYKNILISTAKLYIAEFIHKGYATFSHAYGVTIPEDSLMSSLAKIIKNQACGDDFKILIALETHMQAYNFGRLIALSRNIYQGRLLIDPTELQNQGFGAIAHDFESMLISEDFLEPGAPFKPDIINLAKMLIKRTMSSQIETSYKETWENTILPHILVKMAFPIISDSEKKETIRDLMNYVELGMQKGLEFPFTES